MKKFYIYQVFYKLILIDMDLVNDSPVFDIKPYLPHLESLNDAKTPNWVVTPTEKRNVEFSDKSIESLKENYNKMKFYNNYDESYEVIKQVLSSDVSNRPSHLLCKLHFDSLIIEFIHNNGNVTVEDIKLS